MLEKTERNATYKWIFLLETDVVFYGIISDSAFWYLDDATSEIILKDFICFIGKFKEFTLEKECKIEKRKMFHFCEWNIFRYPQNYKLKATYSIEVSLHDSNLF